MLYKFEKNTKTLELDRVLDMLSNEATMSDAKQMALELKPSTDYDTVSERLKNTEDAYLLMSKYSAPSFSRAVNVISPLARAELGSSLSIRELLDIAEVLRVIRKIKDWSNDTKDSLNTSLEEYFTALVPNKFLESKITFAIKNEEELNDSASPLLSDIRRKITVKSASIRDSLDRIVRGPMAKYLQEAIITQRDGRFVVPVRAECKGEIKGLVHDTSSTGSTLFIEPMSVVETNNEIRVLRLREQDEIVRILAELSGEVADFAKAIKSSYEALYKLNFIFAKAQLAYKMNAIVPRLNKKGCVYLKRARHPLINSRKVVPVTVSLGNEYDTLIITGPNTGGKTVTLKTVGLLTLMAMCGLMIPADDSSEISVFSKIFADIGDEQSIEQSLSTFSSHMVNIISILEECDNNSLVLFDELCAGTDPVEGAALAKAILMRLAEKNAKTVATTHYAELKSYAIDTNRVENASCEFDVATLKPTYRLIIGVPGRSNAFAISSKLGLSDSIISTAKEQISDDDLRFERVVESLEKARHSAEEEHKKALKIRSELEEQKKKTDSLEKEFRANRDKLMESTRQKAAVIIENAREKSSKLLNQLEEMKKGNFTDSEIEAAVLDIENSYKEISDYGEALSEYYSFLDSADITESPDEVAAKIRKVTKEQIVAAANTVKLDTVYFLKGEE